MYPIWAFAFEYSHATNRSVPFRLSAVQLKDIVGYAELNNYYKCSFSDAAVYLKAIICID